MTAVRERQEAWLVALGAVLLVVFAVWRATTGADLADGTHVVALAMRMAQGDAPLTDELNLQALGSLPAVPFTWLWLHVVGVEGLVLASRLHYVALALGVGMVAYRGLRTGFPPVPSFVAVTFMLLATPYSLPVVSYNTGPVLGLGLATCAAFAALHRGSGRWAALAGAALACTAVAHPAMLPSVVTVAVLLLVMAGGGPVVRGLLTGGLGVSLLVVAAVLLGPGLAALHDTVSYTTQYQAARISPWERLLRAVQMHAEGLFTWGTVPALVLALVAAIPWVAVRWRMAAAGGVLAALALAVVWSAHRTSPEVLVLGTVASAYLVLAAVLLAPALVLAVRDSRDVRLVRLAVLTGPAAVVGVVALSMTSSASAKWGVAAAPVQPLVGVAALTIVLLLGRHHRRAVALLMGGVLLLSLSAVHTMRVFWDVQPYRLDARVSGGPLAGLLTRESVVREDCEVRQAVAAWVDPGDSVFFWGGVPGGYAYSRARMDTPILWLADFGAANARATEWMAEHDRWPDVAFIHAGVLEASGGWEEVTARDPVLAAVERDYGPVTEVPGYLVLRRDGTTRAPDATPACG